MDARSPVHRSLRPVDKSGWNMVEKPLPTVRHWAYDVPIADGRGRARGRERSASTHLSPAAGCPGPPPDCQRTPELGEETVIDAACRRRRLPIARGRGLRALL